MMAARLPSRALPQSLEAAKLSIVPLSTRLLQREYPSLLTPIENGGPVLAGSLTAADAVRFA
jgi:hypothetical protein